MRFMRLCYRLWDSSLFRFFCFAFLLSCGLTTATAQAQPEVTREQSQYCSVSGVVQSVSGMRLPDCSIALWRSRDSVLISATVSDREGSFAFAHLTPADYYLVFAHLGYQRERVDIRLSGENIALQPIRLRELSHELAEVAVVAKRPLIKLKPNGEISYAVSADPRAKHSSLYQVLQRVPFVSLSPSGIGIKGSISPTYYINGVPAPQLNQHPIEALKAMRAEGVQEIQLITNPGAQYDGDFAGGVINIITKQRLSSSFAASLGGTLNTRNQYGTAATLALQLGKVIAQGSLTYSDQKGYRERWALDRTNHHDTQKHHFTQEKEREYDRNSTLLSSVQLSWSPNTKHLVNTSLSYTKLDTRGSGEQRHRMQDLRGQTITASVPMSVAIPCMRRSTSHRATRANGGRTLSYCLCISSRICLRCSMTVI